MSAKLARTLELDDLFEFTISRPLEIPTNYPKR